MFKKLVLVLTVAFLVGLGLSLSFNPAAEAAGAQSFFSITPVDVTPGTSGSWVDLDLSAHIPVGSTGAMFHVVNTHATAAYALGFRKNGSMDDRESTFGNLRHTWIAIGVDGNRVCETYIGSTTDIDIYLVGYTTSGVTFFTSAYDKSLDSTGSWVDIDCSVEAPGAVGLIFEVVGASSASSTWGLRSNGSVSVIATSSPYHNCFTFIIGCDGGQICEGKIASTSTDFYLIGYITDGATFYTEKEDYSVPTPSGWLDLTQLPDNSVMGFFEVASSGYSFQYGLRTDGSSEDVHGYSGRHSFGLVAGNGTYIVEGYSQAYPAYPNVGVRFYLVGYAWSVDPGPIPTPTPEPTPSIVLPTITNASGATLVDNDSARLNGELVSDGGGSTTVICYWGPIDGNTTPGSWANADSLGVQIEGNVSNDVGSLGNCTTYYYRYKATNLTGDDWADSSAIFKTTSCPVAPPVPPSITTLAASNITYYTATLAGNLTALGDTASVSVYLQYGVTTDYGNSTTPQVLAVPSTFVGNITGLSDDTTYHFRAVAVGNGTSYGSDSTFTTLEHPTTPWWQPSSQYPIHWQWQLSTDFIVPTHILSNVTVYDIDWENTSAGTVAAIHALGPQYKVIAYLEAGDWTDSRSDSGSFPAGVKGNSISGWPGEKWLDIRSSTVRTLIEARLDVIKAKGFDAVEPDCIDGYSNNTGFPLTYADQLDYNIWLANECHERGLSVGLKGDNDQVGDLYTYFDWALNEECNRYNECFSSPNSYALFVQANKAVFNCEYRDADVTAAKCRAMNEGHINSMRRNLDLTFAGVRTPCVPDTQDVWGYYTAVGSNVLITTTWGTVTFTTVSAAGYTEGALSGTPSVCSSYLPGGYYVGSSYYHIITTAGYSGIVTITVHYTGSGNGLRMFHCTDSGWVDITTSKDTTNKILYGQTSSLSEFVLGGTSTIGGVPVSGFMYASVYILVFLLVAIVIWFVWSLVGGTSLILAIILSAILIMVGLGGVELLLGVIESW